MASNALRRFRISIAFFSFVIAMLTITYYIYLKNVFNSLVFSFPWQRICQLLFTLFTLVFYFHALRFNKSIQKYIRAFLLFVISIVWLYINVNALVIRTRAGMPYVCGPAEYLKAPYGIIICCINRTVEALSILCGFLILIEIWITLKNADAPDKPEAAQVMYVSPDQPVMPHTAYTQQAPYVQPTQYYPPQPQYPYPGMIQQQPTMAQYSGTPKYETQENMYQDYQRQSQAFYQPQQQQQQPQYYQSQQQQQQQQQQSPYASQGYGTPQVPGSMVTAAPQPGASPIIPYPSPGHSVAVSPVLPVGGYSSPHSPVTSAK